MTSSKATRKTRRSPIVWIILSAVVLLLYVFSVAVRTRWMNASGGRYITVLLADGCLAMHTDYEPYGTNFHGVTIEKLDWTTELKLLPGWDYRAAGGMFGLVAPLWLVALPVWAVTFVKWRRSRRVDGNACRKCGYDLRALGDSKRCPECGAARMVA